jgi:hypothetical protein
MIVRLSRINSEPNCDASLRRTRRLGVMEGLGLKAAPPDSDLKLRPGQL